MPNSIAYLILALWPFVCLFLFLRLPLERAMIWCVLAGYLVLPPVAEFDLPLVPDMDKYAIPNISAFLICVFVMGKSVPLWPQSTVARVLVGLFVLGVIPTVLTNGDPILFQVIEHSDPIVFLTDMLPGLGFRDLFSVVSNQVIVLLPFFLARQYLASEQGMRDLLLALVIGGIAYSIPSLIEIRLSPQTNVIIYGFFQHSFEQMMRQGGFRPIVFLPHGLWLAFFMFMTVISAAALSRTETGVKRRKMLATTLYLLVVLVLCKSLASLIYAVMLTPFILFAKPKLLIRMAVAAAFIAIMYPTLRNTGLVPLDLILAQAEAFSADRAQSLGYRFDNEEQLLSRAQERTWFGWGGWGRNLIRHSETGIILSIPDGRWIIVFGTFGWLGYVAEMGLLAWPIFMLGLQMRKMRNEDLSPYVAPIAILLAATMMDMLLNATLIPMTWMCAGAVLGYCERLQAADREAARQKKVVFKDSLVMGRSRNAPPRRTVL